LGAGAVIGMQEAIFADVGVALIAIFNSMRILKKIKQKKQ
jgi:Cd2+/Zn2+-exporting ATPase